MWPALALVMLTAVPAAASGGSTTAPDLSIANASNYRFVGAGIVNATGRHQSVTGEVNPGKTREFVVQIANRASAPQSFTVMGAATGPTFAVAYADQTGDVTSQVTTGTYQVSLGAGKHEQLYVDVTAANDAATGSSRSVWVRAANTTDPSLLDEVRADVTVPPLRVWSVSFNGALRCTAIFPDRTLTPGFQTGVSFTLTNLTDHTFPPMGVEAYLVFRDASGTKLWDTAPKFEGVFPSSPSIAPHRTVKLFGLDTPIRWSGPLSITPVCSGLRIHMPTVQLAVAAPGAPATVSDAIDAAVGFPGSPFQACHPGPNGEPSTGSFSAPDGRDIPPMTLRCLAEVRQENGFDVVSLELVSPSDAPDYTIPENIFLFAIPDLPGSGPFVAARWGFVVTATSARPYLALELSRAPDTPGVTAYGYALHRGSWQLQEFGPCGFEGAFGSWTGTYFFLDFVSACTGTTSSAPTRHILRIPHGRRIVSRSVT